MITLEAVQRAIGQKFSGAVARQNIAAANDAYRIVREQETLVEIHDA